jgi:hypothetical protein
MAVDINGDGLIALGGTSTTQGRVRLAEDTDNGTNYVELTANAAVTTNRTVTFPDANINFTTGLGAAQGGTGLTSVGTSGNVLTSNGTAWVSQAAAAGGGDYVMQVFTTPGTWTKAAGLKAVKVTVIGGGGGSGGAGGTTSFGSPAFLSATGGAGWAPPSPVSGGTGSGGQINVTGSYSLAVTHPGCFPNTVINGYVGGASAFGFGGFKTNSGSPTGQSAGLAYGGGSQGTTASGGGGGGAIEYIDAPALPGPQPYTVGPGGPSSPVPAATGGGAGIVIVEEFY